MAHRISPLDTINRKLLLELQRNARQPYRELARKVGLSLPATVERIRRLEDLGILRGYGARIDVTLLGYPITALLEITTTPNRYPQVLDYARNTPEIRECYFVTGDASFVAKVVARSISHLQELIEQAGRFGSTRTSVVLSTPILKEEFDPKEPGESEA